MRSRDEPERVRLSFAPHTVVGYHGCSRETAMRIVNGEPIIPSANEWDWLGAGAYFWEHAPARALDWAKRRFGVEAAVIEARIRLGRCLNLLDIKHFDDLVRAYEAAISEAVARGLPVPENKPDGRRYLDQRVINLYCQVHGEITRRPYQTVRGCFPEGSSIYPNSAILSRSHIQIAVRDVRCIGRVRWVYCE